MALPTLAISNHGLRNSGGIERYAMTLVRGLHERGIRPTVLAKAFDTSLAEYQWVQPVVLSNRLVPGKLRDLYFDWQIGRAKRRLRLGPLIACNQTRWSDIGICGSTHPGYLEAMAQAPRRADRWKIALERAHLERSQTVVAHSARMRDEAIRFYGLPKEKIALLCPPVDAARFRTVDADTRARIREALGLPPDRAVFLLASTGHRRKGLAPVATLFAATTLPATVVVAGRPPSEASANLRYLGYRNDMEAIYQAADFTIMASRYEPFGLVGVESVLCGTPVVLADNAGCAEVIGESGSLRFDLDEPGGMERAVAAAVARWQAGTHRIDDPRRALSYDPSVAVHVDALLALADAVVARGSERPA